MQPIPYAKMNGIGNAILVVDLRGGLPPIDGAIAEALGQRPDLRFDQLMAINAPRTPGTDAFLDIFNIDGSRAGACGNGTRCVAWTMLQGSAENRLLLETAAGLLPVERTGAGMFSVDMGEPRLAWQDIPLRDPIADTTAVPLPHPPRDDLATFSAVGMGNPHAVFFVGDALAVALAAVGPAIEHDPIFPDRANVSFAEIAASYLIILRTWERGAGATLACGSAACATLVAAARAGLTGRSARVRQRGGDLQITWRDDNHVVMTGDTAVEHAGSLELPADCASP